MKTKKTALTARVPRLALERATRHWFGGHRSATHLSNAMHLLFPAGERFFVRSVLRYEKVLPPELGIRVRGFCRQEGRHAQAHERVFEVLRAQGHDIDVILERYERIAFGAFEQALSPSLRLAITTALEHFTAILAEDTLSRDVLAGSDHEMRRLLEWHAVEELEHKSVAFDTLRVVAPSYTLRILGLVLAMAGLGYFWWSAAAALWRGDGLTTIGVLRDLRREDAPQLAQPRRVLAGIRAYLRPRFHPDDVDHRELIERTLARLASERVFTPDIAA